MAIDGVGLRSSRGPVLLALMITTALVAIDSTVLATAVPSIVGELGDFDAFPWLFSIYLLTMCTLVPVYSKLADTFGRKPIMLIGIGIFLLASIGCAFAWDMSSLIVFRALQGVGAGAIQPLTITVTGDIYTVEERARVQGYIAGVWGGASVVGPALGALFAELHAWRWVFIINIPLCLLGAYLVWRNLRETVPKRAHRIDVTGAVLVVVGLGAVILATLEGGIAWAWDSPVSIALYVGGGLVLLAFAFVELRAAEPVVPLPLFRRPIVVVACGVSLALGAAMVGLMAYTPTYLQVGAGVPPLIAAAALAAMLVGWPLAATFSGRIFLARGFRFTVTFGAGIAAAAAIGLAITAQWPSPWTVGAISLVIGFGFGWTSVPMLVAVQASVPWAERAVATGMVMFTRTLGQAVGAAVLGAVANGVIQSRGGDSEDAGNMIAAGTAVFIGIAIVLVVQFALSWFVPKNGSMSMIDPTAEREAVAETILGIDVEAPVPDRPAEA